MKAITGYLRQAKSELMKVSWPTTRVAVNLTIAVVVFSVILALLVAGLDGIFTLILQKFILKG